MKSKVIIGEVSAVLTEYKLAEEKFRDGEYDTQGKISEESGRFEIHGRDSKVHLDDFI